MDTPFRTLLPALVMVLGLTMGCVKIADTVEDRPPAGLPELPGTAAAWVAVSDQQVYSAEDLFLYINGGAVTWIECGFRQVVVREYTNGDDGRINLEIYEMDDAAAALCIYEKRSGADGEPLQFCEEGRLYDYYLEFRNGRFLVTITSLTAQTGPLDGMAELGAEVADLLNPGTR